MLGSHVEDRADQVYNENVIPALLLMHRKLIFWTNASVCHQKTEQMLIRKTPMPLWWTLAMCAPGGEPGF